MKSDLNDVMKKEIKIKQDDLRALLYVEENIFNVNAGYQRKNILNYVNKNKHELLIDILNLLDIKKFDSMDWYIERNEKDEFTIERLIDDIVKYTESKDNKVLRCILDELISCIAYYSIDNVIEYNVINTYLNMIVTVNDLYIDFPSSDDLKGNTTKIYQNTENGERIKLY